MLKRMMLVVLSTAGFGGVAFAQAPGPAAAPPAVAPAPAPPAAAPPAPAAEPPPPTKPLSISGFVDVTYNYNLNRPTTGANGEFSYDARHNNFALNAAHLAFTGEPETGLSYTIDIDAGTDAVLNTSNFDLMRTDTYKLDVQEAYGVYKRDKYGVRIGKFATFNGIEVIESGSNPTVSRGYLYGLAEPVTNTGVEVFVQATETVDLHLGVVNGWDVMSDNNRGKTLLAKVGLVPSPDSLVTISAYAGPEQGGNDDHWRETLDVTALVKVATLDLNLQGNVGREDAATADGNDATWFGFGIQPVFHASDKFTIGGRVEYFDDNDGVRTGLKVQLVNVTATPGYLITPHLLLRADARFDYADAEVFSTSDGGTSKTQVVLLGEAIASF
jgi:hypothetical protein